MDHVQLSWTSRAAARALCSSATAQAAAVASLTNACTCFATAYVLRPQLAEEDAFDSEKDAASVAYNAAVKGAAKVGGVLTSLSAGPGLVGCG